jgi:hypothetical protein
MWGYSVLSKSSLISAFLSTCRKAYSSRGLRNSFFSISNYLWTGNRKVVLILITYPYCFKWMRMILGCCTSMVSFWLAMSCCRRGSCTSLSNSFFQKKNCLTSLFELDLGRILTCRHRRCIWMIRIGLWGEAVWRGFRWRGIWLIVWKLLLEPVRLRRCSHKSVGRRGFCYPAPGRGNWRRVGWLWSWRI